MSAPDDELRGESEGVEEDDDVDSRSRAARRAFLGSVVAGAMGAAAWALGGRERPEGRVTLRPPGALPEEEFLGECVRCGRCANACPNQCIEMAPITAGLTQMFTPRIHARTRGCTLCGECTKACPTNALTPFDATEEDWLAVVDMGKARVNRDLCYSYHGRTCGACYRACPLGGQAMTIGLYETPIVHVEHCVGCGLCEQACLHLPQAIRVVPTRRVRISRERAEDAPEEDA